MRSGVRPLTGLLVTIVLTAGALQARTGQVTSPKEQFGFELGDDYQLASYKQLTEYWNEARRRIRPHDGRRHRQDRKRAIATDGDHHRAGKPHEAGALQGDRAEAGAGRRADRRSGAGARAAEGKAVVWIDGGLHATEVLGAQQLMQTVYRAGQQERPPRPRAS